MSRRTLAARITQLGGSQLSRINKQKLESLRWALKNSYNVREIETPVKGVWPCFITKNTTGLKSDYDKEYIAVEYDSGLQAGDTFRILDNDTHWMVYLPIITETAYLRAEIIRCRYTYKVNGKEYWIYFQGPTETDLRWFQKNQINVNELNLSGTIYIKNDENTKNYFKRFTRMKLDGHEWEVQVTDSISVPGVLELEVQEYYDNTIEELPKITQSHAAEAIMSSITGKAIVKPGTTVGYMIEPLKYKPDTKWEITDNPRVEIDAVKENGRICEVKIHEGTVKPFTLKYGDEELKVLVDWHKSVIQGPQIVYPYDKHKYWLKDKKGKFFIEEKYDDVAKILNYGDDFCTIAIVAGRKGRFVLSCLLENGEEEKLPVEIKSL